MVSRIVLGFVNKAIIYATLLIAWNFSAHTTNAAAPAEYEVKAAFLYNFAKYIVWPPATAGKPLVIGLIGKDPFGQALDDAMRGQKAQDRPVIVRRFKKLEEITNCDLLFIASSERHQLPRILSILGKSPVVTVADMDQFTENGGMINLTLQRDRVNFDVNVDAFSLAGLKAGSQLLRLARVVIANEQRTDRD
jgi:YfiR/HmsC-like